MNMTQAFEKQWTRLDLGEKVLVAVSTGVDSMSLVDLILNLPQDKKPQIFIAYIDHQLREQSKTETKFIQAFCKEHSLPLFIGKWQFEDHPLSGVEAAARAFRYSFFKKIMKEENITELLTAHHADDQAETFLMKLIRGGELKQLIGIKEQRCWGDSGRISRPLLKWSKRSIRDYATRRGLRYFEDHTNQGDDFLRNRLRHQVIPKLKNENNRFLEHISEYEKQLGQLTDALEEAGQEKLMLLKEGSNGYSTKRWNDLSSNWQNITLRMIIRTMRQSYSKQQLLQIASLLRNIAKPQGAIALGGGLIFIKQYDRFFLEKHGSISYIRQKEEALLRVDEWQKLSDGSKIGVFLHNSPELKENDAFFFFSDASYLPLKVRHRCQGDVLKTKVGHQKIKKIMIDMKMTNEERKRAWLVLTNTGKVMWLAGIKKSDLSERQSNDKIQYMIIFRKRWGCG